jgi:uncharacterized membrane protein YphA (DoxX/SURF4 family)
MANPQKPSPVLHVILWIVQLLLAVSLIWAVWMKLFQPIDKLAAMWPWTGQIPATLVKLTGIVDLAGAVGLLLPSLLRIQPKLTPIAAICIVVLMVCASIFHIARGEASLISVNVVFALLAAFVAWGRLAKVQLRQNK